MMPHNNKIRDTETHFIINPSNRTITNSSVDNNIIVQYDHNSERFTFEIPRYVDGHDMSECKDKGEVRVNYRNSASTGLSKNDGVYICDDLTISTDDKDKVTFSWLLSSAATQYIGYLYFSVQFICFNGDTVAYSWNTGIYKDITIVESINNIEQAVESDAFKELTDLIVDTKETLNVAESVTESANMAAESANRAAQEARDSVCYVKKTEDGKLQILDADLNVIDTVDVCYMDNDTIYRYDNGVLRVVGIKEINADETFRMWVGTNEQYLALSEKDDSTFYWVTDDDTYDYIVGKINEIIESHNTLREELSNGKFVVRKANYAQLDDDGDEIKSTYAKTSALIDEENPLVVEKAKLAVGDQHGNQIDTTYVNTYELQYGDKIIANRAKGDKDGNEFSATYAKISELKNGNVTPKYASLLNMGNTFYHVLADQALEPGLISFQICLKNLASTSGEYECPANIVVDLNEREEIVSGVFVLPVHNQSGSLEHNYARLKFWRAISGYRNYSVKLEMVSGNDQGATIRDYNSSTYLIKYKYLSAPYYADEAQG